VQNRLAFPLLVLTAASAWCIALLIARLVHLGSLDYPSLVWNLTLAWVPLLLALALLSCARRGRPGRELVAIGAVWLLFLPNAPYVLTDFVHLGYNHRLFDSLILGSFAATALALGLASLVIVQTVVTRAKGAGAGWAVVAASLVASSIGIYLGRVQRLNSWDALTHPGRILSIGRTWLQNPLGHQHLMLVMGGFAVFLVLTYLVLYALTSLAATARALPPKGQT
jgi:uncharacterized membrane protein